MRRKGSIEFGDGVFMKIVELHFLPNPTDPEIRIEEALECDGSLCGLGIALMSEDGECTTVPSHSHLIESQPGHAECSYPIKTAKRAQKR
jgi:hypothetical protein